MISEETLNDNNEPKMIAGLTRTVDGSSWCPAGAPGPVVSLMTSYTRLASASARCHWLSERGSWACPLPQMYQSLAWNKKQKTVTFSFLSTSAAHTVVHSVYRSVCGFVWQESTVRLNQHILGQKRRQERERKPYRDEEHRGRTGLENTREKREAWEWKFEGKISSLRCRGNRGLSKQEGALQFICLRSNSINPVRRSLRLGDTKET